MSASRLKKSPIEQVESRDEMENCVREICLLTIRRDEMTVAMDDAIAKIRDRYQAEMSEVQVNLNNEMERAKDWADRNSSEFATKKSIVMVHGTVGFRTGMPKLKTLKGWTWDRVLEVVKNNLPEYVRHVEQLDKERILAERNELGEEVLDRTGIRVVQDESFYVEPNREQTADAK